MSYNQAQNTVELTDEDLFYSRTDERGVIQSANSVFQRISGFSWPELIGAPHKLLRHDTMPKGAFHTMWQTIKSGKPVSCYVRNRTKQGSNYWVLATVLPIEGGYISFRIKPTCGILEQIKPIYEAVRKLERDEDLSPADSAARLEEQIQDLDYYCYEEFSSFALKEEVLSRDDRLGLESDAVLNNLGKMFRDVRSLGTSAERVNMNFKSTHQIPYNMRLQAGRLEGSDGPISVISANHRQMTQNLEEQLSRFSAESSLGAEQVRSGVFKSAIARLIGEVELAIENDVARSEAKTADDLELFARIRETFRKESLDEVSMLSENVRRFGNRCRDMRRLMSGLELTRIMCKIERSKFDGEHAGLDEIVNRLADAQTTLNMNFDEILDAVSNIVVQAEETGRRSRVERRRVPRPKHVA